MLDAADLLSQLPVKNVVNVSVGSMLKETQIQPWQVVKDVI